jgi:hypothetical protein
MEKINQWLTLAANVGVLAGIVFLIIEVEQNTRAQHGSTMQAFVAATAENNGILSASDDLTAIVVRGDSEGIDVLDPVEKRRYLHLATQVFQGWEALYLQTLNGTIDESFWKSKRPGLADTLDQQGVRDFWATNAHLWFDPRFRSEIESIAEERGIEL